MILADKIIEERKKNGWSQEELAEKLGVSRQAVSKWEGAASTPDLQKVIQLADLFGVSTDYLLKDDILPGSQTPTEYNGSESATPLRYVSMEEANEFLNIRKQVSPVIANAVSLCIMSPALVIILSAFSEANMYGITEGISSGVGCTVLFIMIAIAVYMFITSGMKMNDSEKLEKESFETAYGVTGMVKEKKNAYEGYFTSRLAIGVCLCIVSVIPLVIAGAMGASDFVCTLLVGVLLAVIATGVNMIIRVSMIRDSYTTLLQEEEYTKEEKQVKRRMDPVAGIYWCLVTAGYLGWSFYTMRWDFTWIVWPVAGVLYAAITGIMRMAMKKDE
ncbi:MAG: helix-turn-helix transcriptional regulator [Eubacteriales bacterium]|nr:helix-turn-helix transcriptional regulator [Eubacteriales bacterium]